MAITVKRSPVFWPIRSRAYGVGPSAALPPSRNRSTGPTGNTRQRHVRYHDRSMRPRVHGARGARLSPAPAFSWPRRAPPPAHRTHTACSDANHCDNSGVRRPCAQRCAAACAVRAHVQSTRRRRRVRAPSKNCAVQCPGRQPPNGTLGPHRAGRLGGCWRFDRRYSPRPPPAQAVHRPHDVHRAARSAQSSSVTQPFCADETVLMYRYMVPRVYL